MADEPELKTNRKKKSSTAGRLSGLAKLFAIKKSPEVLQDPDLISNSANPAPVDLSAEQDTPYYLVKQLANWIERGFTVNAILDNLLRGLIRVLHLDYAGYFVINPVDEKAQLRMQFTAKGIKPKVANGFSVILNNESILGWVLTQKHEHVVYDTKDSRFTSIDWLLPSTISQATFPVFVNNQVVGFLDFQTSQPENLDNPALDFLRAVAIYLRGVIAQADSATIPLVNIEDHMGQVEQLIRQADNDVELFSLLQTTLSDSQYVSVLFSVQYDHLALKFITDSKRTNSSSTINGLAIPLDDVTAQLTEKNPIIIEDLGSSKNFAQVLSFFSRRGCTSAAIIGILENGVITYILAVGGLHDHPITLEGLAPLLDLANVSGKVLYDLHLISNLKNRLTELEALASVSKAISIETNLTELFQLLHSHVKALVGSDVSFAVTIYNQAQNKIEIPYMTEDDQVVTLPPFELGEGLTSVIIQSQKPLLIHNQQQAASLGAKQIGKSAESWLGVPLIIGTDVVGTMMVQDPIHENRFDETDLNLFLTLAPQVAVAVRNAQLFNQVDSTLSQHKLLHQITVETAAANTIGEAIHTTVDLLHDGLPGSKIAVLLKNKRNLLEIQYSAGFELEAISDLTIHLGQGIIGQAAESAKYSIINDVRLEPNYINLDPSVQSEMAVPITFKGEVLGVLDIELPEKNAFISSEVEIFGTLGNNLGAVIASARLLENVRDQIALQQQIFDATSRIRRSVDMKSIMETSASEIGRILGARRVSIRINPQLTANSEIGKTKSDGFDRQERTLEVNQ